MHACPARRKVPEAYSHAHSSQAQVHADSHRLAAGRRRFLVDPKLVPVICPRGESTCFSVATDPDMPSAETVASTLRQLKNNPRLFEKWRQVRGYTFKANRKMFRGADW